MIQRDWREKKNTKSQTTISKIALRSWEVIWECISMHSVVVIASVLLLACRRLFSDSLFFHRFETTWIFTVSAQLSALILQIKLCIFALQKNVKERKRAQKSFWENECNGMSTMNKNKMPWITCLYVEKNGDQSQSQAFSQKGMKWQRATVHKFNHLNEICVHLYVLHFSVFLFPPSPSPSDVHTFEFERWCRRARGSCAFDAHVAI